MREKLSYVKWCLAVLMIMSGYSSAGTVQIGPRKIESLTVIGNTAFGHQAGNLEIKITNGTGNPAGVTCDQNYLSTKNTSPNFTQMISILLTAQVSDKPVMLGITDDATLAAFGGRCSLVSVTLVN